MSCRITTTKAADQDIRDIASYIAASDPSAARKFGTELWRTFGIIADSPKAGRVVPGFGEPLRVVRVSSRFRRYLIFYRLLDETTIEIVRLLHGARDLAALLADQ